MDNVIIFTPDVKTHKKVLKSFMLMFKKYGMLLTINKVHTFRSKVKYMGLLLSSKDNLPTITQLGSRVKAISTLPIHLTGRGIKSFIGCVIYLAQFLPKLSELIKPINDILKNCNKVDAADKIQPLPLYDKGKGIGRKRSPNIQKFWLPIHTTNFEAIKSLTGKHLFCIYQHAQDASTLSVTQVLNMLAQYYIRYKMAPNMLLSFTVQQLEM